MKRIDSMVWSKATSCVIVPLVWLAMSLLFLTGSCFALPGADLLIVETESSIEGTNEEAKQAAISQSTAKAIEQAMSLLMPFEKLEAHRDIIQEQILANAGQFSATTEVIVANVREPNLAKRYDKGETTAVVRYFIELDSLKTALDDLGVLEEKIPKPKILLLFSAQVNGIPYDPTDSRQCFAEKMSAHDLELIEPEDITRIEDWKPSDGTDRALELGKENDADIVIVAMAMAQTTKSQTLSTDIIVSSSANVSAEALLVATQDAIEQQTFSLRESGSNLSEVVQASLENASSQTARLIVPQVRLFWVERYMTGIEIRLKIQSATYPLCDRLLSVLRRLRWVNSAERFSFVDNTALIDVSIRDTASGLAKTLDYLPNSTLEIVEVGENRIVANNQPLPGKLENPKE